MIYNDMRINRNILHQYIQEFLWDHWRKKINPFIKDDDFYRLEIFLKKK